MQRQGLLIAWLITMVTFAFAGVAAPPADAPNQTATERTTETSPETRPASHSSQTPGRQAVDAFGSGLTTCTPPITPVTLSNPTIVTTCTQAGLQAALDQGGHITFDCGPNPVTIDVTSPLMTSNTEDTVLDGKGLITLDGGNSTRILVKPFTPGTENDKTLGNDLTIQNMRFINAKAPASNKDQNENGRGGAIQAVSPGTKLHIINSTFEDNRTTSLNEADNQGGAIFSANIYETVIVGSVFDNNEAGNGGAFGGIATGLLVYNSKFTGNKASDNSSGGIVKGHGGALHLDGVTNRSNPDSNKIVDVCGSVFEGNTAVRGGGAIKTTISDNKGTKATYARSTFTNNRLVGVPPTEGHGGAIYHLEDNHTGGSSEDNLEISESTFVNNYAYKQGGALWLYILGNGRVVNSTFSENEVSEAGSNRVGQGGALIVSLGKFEVINSTFANNFASYQGGAIFMGKDDPQRKVTLSNSLFYKNYLDPTHTNPVTTEWQGYHTNKPMQDGGNNLQFPRKKEPDFDNDVNNLIVEQASAIIFDDPLIESLADNGGPNQTIALKAGSPAIDQGNNCPATDQRGANRVGTCDIGAFEFGGTPPTITPLTIRVRVTDLNGTLPYTETVAYHLILKNNTAATAADVVITNTLPGEVSFADWVQQAGAVQTNDTIKWGPQDMTGGEQLEVIFKVDINAPVGTQVKNTATFGSSNGATGSGQAVFTVGQPPERPVYMPLILK